MIPNEECEECGGAGEVYCTTGYSSYMMECDGCGGPGEVTKVEKKIKGLERRGIDVGFEWDGMGRILITAEYISYNGTPIRARYAEDMYAVQQMNDDLREYSLLYALDHLERQITKIKEDHDPE